jgi:hypothetical protein
VVSAGTTTLRQICGSSQARAILSCTREAVAGDADLGDFLEGMMKMFVRIKEHTQAAHYNPWMRGGMALRFPAVRATVIL